MTTPTTHPIDEALVEALAGELVVLIECWDGGEAGHPDDCSDESWNMARGMARNLIALHRLVQLPEEPYGWQAEVPSSHPNGPGWVRPVSKEYATDEALGVGSNRIRPIYRIPGPPIPVQQETDDE